MILANGTNQTIAPQALAETAPLFFNGYFVGSQGLQLETRFATYAQLYLTQPWVATVVDKVAASIARLGVNVWDTSPATGNVLKLDTPYAQLMSNPGTTLNPFSFWQWLASTIEVYGEAFLLKIKDGQQVSYQSELQGIEGSRTIVSVGGKTVGLVPMHPSMTQIFRGPNGDPTYWFMGQPNVMMAKDMVVPFVRYNPNMTQRGVSRLEPLRSTLMNEDSTRRAIQAWWKNMGRPAGVITVKGKLDPPGKQRLREQWNMLYQGSENVGSTAVLENEATFEALQLNAEEMQYIESRKLNREEVCAVFDIPPPVVHILDRATFSNITEQMRSMYRDTIAPRIEFIESVLNYYVGREFGEDEIMRFDTAEVLRGDFETRADAWTKLVQQGIAKPSEARPNFDLGDAGPVADKLYAQQQLQPLGMLPEQIRLQGQTDGSVPGSAPSLPPGQSDTGKEVPSSGSGGGGTPVRSSAKYIRDLGGRIGRGQALEDAARELLSANPSDEIEIKEACLKILERKSA